MRRVVGHAACAADSPREHLSLDAGWKFHLGDDWPDALHLENSGTGSGPASEKFADTYWRVVNLPHDWAVELPFDWAADGSHGFKTLGAKYPTNSIAWYRRTFELPEEDEGKRIWLTFDGVFRDATVWVNGWCVRHHEGGYYPFREDITDVVHFGGKNTVAVRVDATKVEGWFYEGAGIYRHVWLDKTAPVAIAPDGIFVRSEFEKNIPQGSPEIAVEVRLLNTSDQCDESDGELRNHFARRQIAETVLRVGDIETQITRRREIGNQSSPRRFFGRRNRRNSTSSSPPFPSPAKSLIEKETVFGIRTVGFDPNNGFLLNGKPYRIYGTCNHQDHAGVGAAIPDALQEFRVKKLKEFGCNAYSHLAQSAHAGIARCLRPARHAGHGRKPVDGQRFGEPAKVGRPNPPRPQSSERRDLVHRQRAVHGARTRPRPPTSRARCRIT